VLRDTGPRLNLGFGQQYKFDDDQEKSGLDPNGGAFGRMLHGHPLAKFFAVSAATLVGAHVAGSLVKKGGVQLGLRLGELAAGTEETLAARMSKRLVRDYRDFQGNLDKLQGVVRELADDTNIDRLFVRTDEGVRGDKAHIRAGWEFSYQARRKAVEEGAEQVPEMWTIRDEIQQRLVSQARRLPYELPAAYVTQRLVTDNLFGRDDPNAPKINWKNPLDVIGDFAWASTKNLATMMLPWESAGGAAKQGFRKFATYNDLLLRNPRNTSKSLEYGVLSLKTLLGQVGADSTDLLNKGIKLTQQTTGAISTYVNESNMNSVSWKQWWKAAQDEGGTATGGFARRNFSAAKAAITSDRMHAATVNALPAPFKGMGAGIKKAFAGPDSEFQKIGRGFDDFQNLVSGRVSFDDLKGLDNVAGLSTNDPTSRVANLYSFVRRSGQSRMEELASEISAAGGPTSSPGWKQGKFFQMRRQQAYENLLSGSLEYYAGVDKKVAERFVQSARVIKTPLRGAAPGDDIMARFSYSKEAILAKDEGEWLNKFEKSLGRFGPENSKKIRGGLKDAVTVADSQFGSPLYRKQLENQATKQWNFVYDHIFPNSASEIFAPTKMPYEDFSSPLNSAKKSFLIRRSASALGVRTADSSGRLLDDAVIKQQLYRKGLNPNNPYHLTAFLQTKGLISQSWSEAGTNMFGFKPMTFADAYTKGYFAGTDKGTGAELKRLHDMSLRNDPVSKSLAAVKMRGVYQSSNGDVLDLSRLGRRVRRFADRLADEVQVPLLHIRPFSILGYNAFRDSRDSSIIQYAAGNSAQFFLPKGDATKPGEDFFMWVRNTGRGTKGKVLGIGGGGLSGPVQETRLPGMYRSFNSQGGGVVPRHLRLALGETGVTPEMPRTGWRKWFDVNEDQPDSLTGLVRRWRNFRNPDHADFAKNTRNFANLIADPKFNVANLAPEQAQGFKNFRRELRAYGFSRKAVEGIEKDGALKDLFSAKGSSGRLWRFSEISDPNLPSSVDKMLQHDMGLKVSEGQRDQLRRASTGLSYMLREGKEQSYWDRLTPQATRSVGVQRRIDEFRNEVYRYVAARNQVVSGNSLEDLVPDLFGKIESLKNKGVLNTREVTEARAAILGLQVNYASFVSHNAHTSEMENIQSALGSFFGGGAANSTLNRGVLQDFGAGRISLDSNGFIRNKLQAYAKRQFGQIPYEVPGASEYSPFGKTNRVFVPTFGTAAGKSRTGALKSVLGMTTWSDPQSFSASSIYSGHFVERLNRYFGTFGLGLDASSYAGPMDMYARGYIGRRVLPAVAAGATALTLDRTLGGALNPKDKQGNRVYSPYILTHAARGLVEAQSTLAGVLPGGKSYSERKEQLLSGEVPIRQGRFWALGNTPFKGGRIQYYRPSWYQRLSAAGEYTPEMNQTPLERLAFGYDFSPLRPLDPYRFERENYSSRPYPVSGDYFSGPWGPLTGALNATVGKVLKPRKLMHQKDMKYIAQQFQSVGEAGSYFSVTPVLNQPDIQYVQSTGRSRGIANAMGTMGAYGGGAGGGYSSVVGGRGAATGRGGFSSMNGVGGGRGMASQITTQTMQYIGDFYSNEVYPTGKVRWGVPNAPGRIPQRVVPTAPMTPPNQLGASLGMAGYQTQEMLGIYGFTFATARENLGIGTRDFTPKRAMLEPANRGYSSGRTFWGMNLGGLGDLPLPIEGNFANFEISEIVRRFVPKEPTGLNYVNNIPNDLGRKYPWLPGVNYPLAPLKTGDPYGTLPDATLRVPGTGYMRTHQMFPDRYGQIGIANIHDILGDVAPWSEEFKALDKQIDSMPLGDMQRAKISQTRAQVSSMRMKNEFTPYAYKYSSPEEMAKHPLSFAAGRAWEWLAHRDTYFNTKFLPVRTAQEDWERENVYGATFPQWQHPIKGYFDPLIYKSTQRNPFVAAGALGTVGSLFGVSPQAKAIGAFLGGATGFASSSIHWGKQKATGRRYLPAYRRQELALEEFTDILSYTRAKYMASRAQQMGDQAAAAYFSKQSEQTMYGANLDTETPEDLALGIPKRKREHFRALLYAPPQERKAILSTSGRLERRIYEAAWGMKVEKRPDLNEYFQEHELPAMNSPIWSPQLNMENVKIKIGQSMGLDLAQMGYYPQQIAEANMINPPYPSMNQSTHFGGARIESQLRRMIYDTGLDGSVRKRNTPFGDNRVRLTASVA
jgi:hypothetical protein